LKKKKKKKKEIDADMLGRPSSNWFLLPVTTVVLVGFFCLSTLQTGNVISSEIVYTLYRKHVLEGGTALVSVSTDD
jgi:hypothetical protein